MPEKTAQPGTIRLSQYIDHPPADVWHALTDPTLLSKWWAPGDIKPIVGHRFNIDMGKWGKQPCEIIDAESQRVLSYTFAPHTLGSTITWRLEPENTGTRLHFQQSGFDVHSPMGKTAFEGMTRGWPSILQRIAAVLSQKS